MKNHGPCAWTECAKIISGRTGKQCRERWVNTLDPDVKKGNWGIDEQNQILDNLLEYGTSWSVIAKNMHGRTENAIKNYFYSTIRRIQSSKAYDFVADIINSVIYNPDRFDNDEQFAEYYEFEK